MRIVLFDGVCNLCNGAVRFLIKRDQRELFKYASLKSKIGVQIIRNNRIPQTIDSIVLYKNRRVYIKSDAILEICKDLGGGWKLLYGFILLPKSIRDTMYNYVAKNRYKWFGKRDACMLPTPEIKKRFIDDTEEIN